MLRTTDAPFGGAREANVLKITISETPTERKWVVAGRLVGPWVNELRNTWARTRRSHDKRTCTIDLSDVTFIDKGGERLLRAMSKRGAQFVAEGIYIKHVLEQLKRVSRSERNDEGARL